MNRAILTGLTIGLGMIAPGAAAAQDAPPATAEQFVAAVADPHADDDVTLRINDGANLAYGNARSLGLTLGALFSLRQAEHAFVAEGAWNYGLASVRALPEPPAGTDPDYTFGDWAPNANNFNARLRYDFYVTPDDSVWAEGRLRYDPFAFLVPQVALQAGYQRVLFREENHRLWVEIGADYSYQNFGTGLPGPVGGVDPANQLADRSIFAYKALLGYTNETNSGFTYSTRLEVLGTIVESVPTALVDGTASTIEGEPGHIRMQWVNQFRSTIEDWLQLSVDITGRFDSLPAGQSDVWNEDANQPTQMFDLLATLNLVGNFDLDGTEPVEEEPEADVDCPVCAEAEACPVAELEPEPEPEPAPEPEAAPEPESEPESEPAAEAGAEAAPEAGTAEAGGDDAAE